MTDLQMELNNLCASGTMEEIASVFGEAIGRSLGPALLELRSRPRQIHKITAIRLTNIRTDGWVVDRNISRVVYLAADAVAVVEEVTEVRSEETEAVIKEGVVVKARRAEWVPYSGTICSIITNLNGGDEGVLQYLVEGSAAEVWGWFR